MKARYSVVSNPLLLEGKEYMVYGILAVGDEGTFQIDDVTTSPEKAKALVLRLTEQDVDPIHLHEIIYDFLVS